MGKEFLENIQKYRLRFPARKLPSGKPARVNVKTLERSYRRWLPGVMHAKVLVCCWKSTEQTTCKIK